MKKRARRFLSVLLALTLILSHADLSFAKESGKTSSPAAETKAGSGKELEMKEVDPAKLGVKKLGEAEEADPEQQTEISPYNLDDIVRVSIFLSEPGAYDAGYQLQGIGKNAAAINYQKVLYQHQNSMKAKIETATGHTIDVVWNLVLLTNAISANVRYGDLEKIRAIDGVKSVELESFYYPDKTEGDAASPNMVSARDMVGANGLNATQYTGAGSILAIIDTGLDIEHQSFDADAFDFAIAEDEELSGKTIDLLTEAEVNSIISSFPGGRRGTYISSKIPYAYNYVDSKNDVTHVNDQQGEHGSHVAGIATANRYIKSDDGFVDAAETVKVVGEAPDAQILVMKVFGKNGGAADSDYMLAVEDAVRLGASSANLSLGSRLPGISTETDPTYMAILNNLENSGLVLSVSMGNNTSWDSKKQLYSDDVNLMTGGSPGSFSNSLTVASIDDSGLTASLLHFDNYDVNYVTLSGSGTEITSLAGNYEFIYVDGPGYTVSEEDYNERNSQFNTIGSSIVSGKVALCNRGTSYFYMKAVAALKAGAIAVVIVNNQPGSLTSATVEGYADFGYTEPVVGVKQVVGETLKANYTKQTVSGIDYYVGSIKIDGADEASQIAYYEMSDFSSWGVPGALTLKPEITAPGGSVLSLNGYHQDEDTAGQFVGGHDQYELMSGTSMAAPQITGLTAALAQYYRDNGIAEKTGLSARHFVQSEMMATAVPVLEEESRYYYSLLKQGAGLANLEGAVTAKSFIKMGDSASLTADDYKVKAELGDDPSRTGLYTYTFEIHNFSDENVEYSLRTDVFTQALSADKKLMEHTTEEIDAAVSYVWDEVAPFAADVNRDGVTDAKDADAILSYITGENDGSDYDLAAGELDGVEGLSSRDAYVLLTELDQPTGENHIVKAGKSRTITVTINLTDAQKAKFNAERPGGAYIEAFTFIESENDTTYSIPVLGFYGSWTDASMFDAVRYEEVFYESTDQTSYFLTGNNATNTNLWNVRYDGSTTANKYSGNPYIKEDAFPADRLAMSSSTVLYNVRYNLIRAAAGMAFVAIDEDGNVINTVSGVISDEEAAYYNTQQSTPSWLNTSTKSRNVNVSVSSLGLEEGDKFTFGFFAFPEYYTYQANGNDQTFNLTAAQIKQIVNDGNYGKGAYIGYTVTLDNTAPVIGTAVMNDDGTVTVPISDNQYVAYVCMMDVSGKTRYIEIVPEQSGAGESISFTFDPADYNLGNAVTVFVGDYAGNEAASIVRLADGPIVIENTVYRLTSTLEAGKKYLIVNAKTAGSRYALGHGDGTGVKASDAVTVVSDSEGLYIDEIDVDSTSVWTVSDSYKFNNQGYYLRRNNTSLQIDTTDSDNVWSWDGTNNRLSILRNTQNYYLTYTARTNVWNIGTAYNSVYLYVEEVTQEIINPEEVSAVNVTPATLALYTGDTANLNVEVLPVTASNKNVSWTSSDTSVATVSETGVVTAVSGGTATITATSVADATKYGTCEVTVTAVTAMPGAYVYAQLSDESGDNFVKIDLGDRSTEALGVAAAALYGGGRSDSYIVGFDSSSQGNVHVYMIGADGSYTGGILGSFGANTYNSRDGAHIPELSAEYEGETISEYYHSLYFCASYLLLFDANAGSITGWGLSGYAALTYVGTDTETGDHYYYTLNSRGQLVPMMIGLDEEEPVVLDEETGEPVLNLSLGYGEGTAISGLTFGVNYMSMSLIDTENYYGLLIANSNTQQIWFVDLTAETLNAVLVAGFTGATSISTLHNNDYDASVVPLGLNGAKEIERMKADITASGIPAVKAEKIASLTTEAADPVLSDEEPTEVPAEVAEAPVEVTEAPVEEPDAAEPETEAEPIVTEAPAEEPIVAEPETEAEPIVTEAPAEEPIVAEPETEAEPAETEAPAEAPAEEPAPAEEVEDPVEEPEAPAEEEIEEELEQVVVTPEPAGGLNALRVRYLTGAGDPVQPQAIGGSTEQDEAGTVTLSITEDVAVTNGYIVITCDAASMFDITATSDLDHFSAFRDKDEIVFAYANKTELAAGTVLLKLTFKSSCGDPATRVLPAETRQRNENLNVGEGTQLSIPAGPHDWAEPTYEFVQEADGMKCYAEAVCKNNSEHKLTAVAYAEITDSAAATCTEDGYVVYTAVFTDSEVFTTQTKREEIPATGHDYSGAPTSWNWTGSEDTAWTAATAVFTCKTNAEHETKEVTANVTSAVSEDGNELVYTATVTGPDGETYTDEKRIAFKYYLIGSMTEWTPDSAYAFAPNEGTAGEYILHVDALPVGAELKVVRSAGTDTAHQTWYPDNAGNYTVDYAHSGSVNVYFRPAGNYWNDFFTGGFFYISKLHTVTVITDGHGTAEIDPANPDFTATVTLTVEPAAGYHFKYVEFYMKTGPGENEIKEIKPAAVGWSEKTMTFTMPDYDLVIKVFFATHMWGLPSYNWTQDEDGHWHCTAKHRCSVCGAEESEEGFVNMTQPNPEMFPEYPAPTCDTPGWTCYTATFKNSAFKTQKIYKEDIPPYGHLWGEPEWVWTGSDEAGYTSAKATFICEHNSEHTLELTDSDLDIVRVEPTLESDGSITYTASVTVEGIETPFTDTKTVTLPKLETYKIILTNYNEELITTSLVADEQYLPGAVEFTVTSDMACVVAVENEDGSFTVVPCTTTDDGEHKFTVTITNADVKVSIAFRGDANLDGEVDSVDMLKVKNHYMETKLLSGFALIAADANMDGEVDSVDMLLIKKLYLEMIDSLDW